MSRPGITYQEVANAAAELQGQQENPTVDRIRGILGTGSKSTIARLLKSWKSNTKHIEGAQDIPQELLSVVKGLWQRLEADAQQKVDKHQQEANIVMYEAQLKLAQEQKQIIELNKQVRERDEKLHQAQHLSTTLQQTLEEEKRSNAQLIERNERLTQQHLELKSETQKLHQLLSHTQNNLEHYQHSMQKLREEQLLASEKERTNFEKEIHTLKNELANESKLKNTLLIDIVNLQTQHTQIAHEASIIREANISLEKQLHEKTKNESNLQHQCSLLSEKNKQNHMQNKEQIKTILELEKNLAVVNHQLINTSALHTQALDTIQALRDEKHFITQEKSQLEGQLRQLELIFKNTNSNISKSN